MKNSVFSLANTSQAVLLVYFVFVSASGALAEPDILEMHVPFTTITDADGNDPTDETAPLYRRGPGNPLTDKDGNSVTLGQLREMDGTITIEAIPGGGTNVMITAANLLTTGRIQMTPGTSHSTLSRRKAQ